MGEFTSTVRRHYPEDDLGRLFAAGEQIQALTRQPGWGVLMELLEDERSSVEGRLNSAKPLDHVEYVHGHGVVRGLGAAAQIAFELESRYVAVLEDQRRKHEGAGESAPERTGA